MITETEHEGVAPFEEIITGFYYTRWHYSSIPLRYVVALPHDIGAPLPTPIRDSIELDDGDGPFPYMADENPLYPGCHLRGHSGSNYSVNFSDQQNSGASFPESRHRGHPVFTEGSNTDDVTPATKARVFEDEVCNALYNVKEWRVKGNIRSYEFDYKIPAGCRRNVSVRSGEEDFNTLTPDPEEDRVFEGRRGLLGAALYYDESDWVDSETPHTSVDLAFSIGNFWSAAETLDTEGPTPNGLVPCFDLAVYYYDSGEYNPPIEEGGDGRGPFPDGKWWYAVRMSPNAGDAGGHPSPRVVASEDECKFLGRHFKMYENYNQIDPVLDDISVEISVSQWWDEDDEWVERWA